MNLLSLQFTESGFAFEQVARVGNVAIYKKERIGGQAVSFETIIVQRHNGFSIAGQDHPPAEFYPTAKAWGAKGWTFTSLEGAQAKATQLIK